MRTSLKAALAGVAGAGLLLGGAGSLAYWNDTEDTPGGTIVSGVLDLGAPVCDDWLLDGTGGDFLLADNVIVPGDSISQTCELVLDVSGKHATAELEAAAPKLSGGKDLDAALEPTAVYELDTNTLDEGDSTETSIDPESGPVDFTELNDGHTLRVTLTLVFPFDETAVDNSTNNGFDGAKGLEDATLDDMTITVTQTNTDHEPTPDLGLGL